jgi:hypothetical protein
MLFETSAETLKLRAFLAAQPPGARISYSEIEATTGVPMNSSGRGKLRRAAIREKLPYDSVISWGIEMAAAENGVRIVGGRLERIRRATVRTEKTHQIIQQRFLEQMNPQDHAACLYIGVVFASMNAAAEKIKMLYSKRSQRKLENT